MNAEPITLEERRVKLTLTSRHYTAAPSAPSLFDGLRPNQLGLFTAPNAPKRTAPYDPEDFPDDMETAVQELCASTGTILPGESYSEGCFDDPEGYADDGDPFDTDDVDELHDRLAELLKFFQADPADEGDDAFVFQTEALLARQITPDGGVQFEISYQEADSMDDTSTVIRFAPSNPHEVVIFRTGDVISTLCCEKGRRHISSYETPIAPFEVAVFTKDCGGSLSYEKGGSIEVDYIIEIRGMNVQRTKMTIDVR